MGFPYEPVPCSPQLAPYKVKVQKGEVYQWCACGECRTQPWCEDNGGPAGCLSRGFTSIPYIPRHTGTKLICGCKHCPQKPLFSGSCYTVWADYNIVQAAALSFSACFVGGVIITWMAHP